MKERYKEYITKYPDDPPDWYWVHGLHDACINFIEKFEFPFDYDKFISEKSRYNRNLLLLDINASGALYDTKVKEMRFYNYKILSGENLINDLIDNGDSAYWLADRLDEKDGKYFLEADLQCYTTRVEDFTVKIKFDRAEVVRD